MMVYSPKLNIARKNSVKLNNLEIREHDFLNHNVKIQN